MQFFGNHLIILIAFISSALAIVPPLGERQLLRMGMKLRGIEIRAPLDFIPQPPKTPSSCLVT
jgi:hypothetical protein